MEAVLELGVTALERRELVGRRAPGVLNTRPKAAALEVLNESGNPDAKCRIEFAELLSVALPSFGFIHGDLTTVGGNLRCPEISEKAWSTRLILKYFPRFRQRRVRSGY